MNMVELLTMLLWVALALGASIAAIVGFASFLQLEKHFGRWIVPAFIPLMLCGIALGSVLSGRNLSRASMDMQSINAMAEDGGGGGILRLINFALVGLAGARIFGGLLQGRQLRSFLPSAQQSGQALYMTFFAFFTATVSLNGLLGTHPAFIHNLYYFLLVTTAVYLARDENLELMLRFARDALLIFLGGSLLLALIKPGMTLQPAYQGWIPGLSIRLWGLGSNPNSIGPLALLFLLLLFLQPYGHRLLRAAAWATGFAVLLLAQSKTSWLAALLAAGLIAGRFLARRRNARKDMLFGVLLIALLSGIAVAAFFVDPEKIWQKLLLSPSGSEVLTLTGRTRIWSAALAAWRDNPLFGYGPAAWGAEHRFYLGMPFAFSAHNQFLQALSSAGLFGLLSLVAYFLLLAIGAWRARKPTEGVSLALFSILFVRSLTETPLSIGTLLNGDAIAHLLLLAMAWRGFSSITPVAGSAPVRSELQLSVGTGQAN